MNLALEKGERVTTGSKGKGEAGEVTEMDAVLLTMDSLGKKCMEHLVDGRWKCGGTGGK